MTMHFSKKTGFTLIELAIVLVVLGLIVGGVVVGKDLIRNSQLMAVTTEYGKYTQAINQFRNKYNALPGDFTGATAMWGQVSTDATLCRTTSSGNNETCDGNGDGRIVTLSNYDNTAYEMFRAWQHLGNAQLIDGNYSGKQGPTDQYDRVPGTNIPASRLSGAGWTFVTITTYDITNAYTNVITYSAGDIAPRQVLLFGGGYVSTNLGMKPIMTAYEAFGIDQKLDDGIPQYGKIVGQSTPVGATKCNTTVYNTGASGNICALAFKTDL